MLVLDKTLSTYWVHWQIIELARELIGQFQLPPARIGLVEFDVTAKELSELTADDSALQVNLALDISMRTGVGVDMGMGTGMGMGTVGGHVHGHGCGHLYVRVRVRLHAHAHAHAHAPLLSAPLPERKDFHTGADADTRSCAPRGTRTRTRA